MTEREVKMRAIARRAAAEGIERGEVYRGGERPGDAGKGQRHPGDHRRSGRETAAAPERGKAGRERDPANLRGADL